MENFKIESRYMKLCNELGLLLDALRLLFTDQIIKTLNVSVNQKTRSSICFKTCGRAFERLSRAFEELRENQKLGREFEQLGRVFVL